MGASNPERAAVRAVAVRAGLVGGSLGLITIAAGSILLAGGPGILTEASGLIATALVALAAGIWVGAPAARAEELPMRQRWATAGLVTAGAGVYATAWERFEAIGAGGLGRALGLLLLVALPVYVLGMTLPILLAAGERIEETHVPDEDGWGVLGLVVLGALVGVTLGIVIGGLFLIPWVPVGPILLASSVFLLGPLVMPDSEEPSAEEVTILEVGTAFSRVRVTETVYTGERQPERRLYLNGEEESAELLRSGAPALAYIAAGETWLANATPPGSSYLFLGGGAYTLPRRVAERDPRARITVVELDPMMTELAQQFFGLRKEHRIISVHGDARAFVGSVQQTPRFDRVYLDVYAGAETPPYSVVTLEAFSAIAGVMRAGGVAAMNLIGTTVGPERARLWSVVRTFAAVFPSVALYHHLGRDYPERQNFLLAGALEAGHVFSARAGVFDRWAREEWPEVREGVVYRDLYTLPATGPDALAGKAAPGDGSGRGRQGDPHVTVDAEV